MQPDMKATGPRGRNIDEGFEVGFEDLPEGRLTKINVEYFRYLDQILAVLVEHGLTPVLQPVFSRLRLEGSRRPAGPVVPPEEYARYCRYLVARYGARPAVYLVGADGSGTEPQIEAGGQEVHRWDAYGQPTGFTTSRTRRPTRTRRRPGSTSSGARPVTRATTSPTGWPTSGATPPPKRS